jgi:hypothetical protein
MLSSNVTVLEPELSLPRHLPHTATFHALCVKHTHLAGAAVGAGARHRSARGGRVLAGTLPACWQVFDDGRLFDGRRFSSQHLH